MKIPKLCELTEAEISSAIREAAARSRDDDEVLDVWWHKGGLRTALTIGAVLVRCKVGGHKAYISVVSGEDLTEDVRDIAEWGAPLDLTFAKALWPHVTDWYEECKR